MVSAGQVRHSRTELGVATSNIVKHDVFCYFLVASGSPGYLEPQSQPARASQPEHGIWNMRYGIWEMVYGIWDMEYGIWNMGYGVWDKGYGIWNMEYGILNMG